MARQEEKEAPMGEANDQNDLGGADDDAGQESEGGEQGGEQDELSPDALEAMRNAAYEMTDRNPDEFEPGSDQDLEFLQTFGPYAEPLVNGLRKQVEVKRLAEEAEAERLATEQAEAEEVERLAAESPEEKAARVTREANVAVRAQVEKDLQANVFTKTEALQSGKIPFQEQDTVHAEVEAYLFPAEILAATMTKSGISAVERVDAWAAADPHVRETARYVFGVKEPFDVDVTSDGYKASLQGTKESVDPAWVAAQLQVAEQIKRTRRK